MNIFKNKSVIRLYAFITACIIVITLLLSGINVCAEGVSDYPVLSDLYDFNDGILYSDDIDGEKPKHMLSNASQDTTLVSFFTEYMNLGCPITPLWYEQQVYKDTTTYPCYLFVSDGSSSVTFIQLPEGSFIVDSQIDSSDGISSNRSFYIYSPTNITNHCLGISSSYSNSYYSFSYNGTTTIDGDSLYYAFDVSNLSGSSNYILNTNMPIHVNSDSNNSMIDSMEDVSGDINPSNSSGSDSGDATNNMYFKDFNISYSVSGLSSGNVVCYGTLNDYQKEHLDEFALTYTFNFDYSFYVPSVGGWTQTLTKNYSYQQTLSDFYNNSSSKTFTLKDIMQNINTQDISSEYGNLYQFINHYANQGTGLDSVEVNWTKAKMKTTVFIVSANNSPSEILNSSNLHSNSFSKSYNFLDGKSSTYSDGITSNNNPFQTSESGSISDQNELNNMPDGVSSSNIPSSQGDNGGSGTSVVTGDNNIVINNNPTFTNNGGSGSGGGSSDGGVASTFYNTFNPFKTLFSSLNGDNNVISDDTAESIGANRFISVMSSTFSFIPEGMWTALTTFFIASLSILVVAVVIRVLLDLL